jgi:hypothetical protein
MVFSLSCIVEGHGDEKALPVLLRRLRRALSLPVQLNIPPPLRRPRNALTKAGGLEAAVELAARRVAAPRGILVVLDADDDCPAELGPSLLERARATRPDIPIAVVLAKREYEAWFLAALPSLCGKHNLADQLPEVANPEGVRGAKEYLERWMIGGAAYKASIHQAVLTADFDLPLARSRSDSFDKLWREVERLLVAVRMETDDTP